MKLDFVSEIPVSQVNLSQIPEIDLPKINTCFHIKVHTCI